MFLHTNGGDGTAGAERNVGVVQGKTQHVQHAAGHVGVGIHSAAALGGSQQSQGGKPVQRGGDVQSNLRISSEPIHSDLIALGSADVIISMEPMEALRYLPYLKQEGWIITSSTPFVNIPNYPKLDTVMADLNALPNVVAIDIEKLAKDNGVSRSANVILLGAAQKALGIEYDKLEEAIRRVFGRKGDAVVEANIKALALGRKQS